MPRRLSDRDILATLRRTTAGPCTNCGSPGTVLYSGQRLCDACGVARARLDDAPARDHRTR